MDVKKEKEERNVQGKKIDLSGILILFSVKAAERERGGRTRRRRKKGLGGFCEGAL